MLYNLRKILRPLVGLIRCAEKRLSAHVPDQLFKDRSDIQDVFSSIYNNNVWGQGSGGGSTLDATKEYVHFLQNFIQEKKIQSVLDIGCGDWRFSAFVNWTGVQYFGIDVVSTVIDANIQNFTRDNIHFKLQNPLNADFIMPKVDLVIIKDVLQHLSNDNVFKMLKLLCQAKYVLATNDYAKRNLDALNGDTRPLNLLVEPFNLKALEVLIFGDKRTVLLVNEQPEDVNKKEAVEELVNRKQTKAVTSL